MMVKPDDVDMDRQNKENKRLQNWKCTVKAHIELKNVNENYSK